MPKMCNGVLVWGSDIELATIDQAVRAARLPFVPGHVALMPDAHVGIGATVGSVIPTLGAIIPSAIGVDIGCGVVATHTNLTASDLPDSLEPLLSLIGQRIPAGVGKGHAEAQPDAAQGINRLGGLATDLTDKQRQTARCQFGTLGSGNHFIEVCLDETGNVWTVLHSGSRGIGNQLATQHIEQAKGLMAEYFITLEDPDLAYLAEGTPEFDAYIADMLWAQRYAYESRARMNTAVVNSLFEVCGVAYEKDPWRADSGAVLDVINCHHNFTVQEMHGGRELWITRKGAIKAAPGDLGIVPGSMGTSTYIVEGLGFPASYDSCSHGAGRRLSRGQARRTLDAAGLTELMRGKTWQAAEAQQLLDEDPRAYKDVAQVMADQADLCRIVHTLTSVLNFKGTK